MPSAPSDARPLATEDLNRRRWAAVVEFSGDGVFTKNRAGVITSWNRGAEQLYGYRAEEAIGQPVTLLVPENQLSEVWTILARVLDGERVAHYETRRLRRSGDIIDVSLTVSPGRDAAGHIVEASVIARDITRDKRLERYVSALADERRRLVAQALNADDRARERLAQRLHDDPLQLLHVAQLELELAAEEPSAERLAAIGETLTRARERLRATVTDLHPVAETDLDLRERIERLGASHETASGARWRFSADIRTEVGAFGRQLLASLARELLANAARHARAREVSVAVTREDGHVLLRVSDDGEGITPGRVEAARAEGHIGLAAQRARVEALSGWFAVSGSEGGGTTVVAAIPTAVADAAGELSHAAPAGDD